MTLWLLDTNVLSELRRPKPNRGVVDFIAVQELAALYVSTVTIAEIRYGIELQADATKRDALERWLQNDIRPMFHDRILPIGEDVMLRWRMLVDRGHRENHTFSQPDLIIAATALHHGMTIVSRDKTGFVATGAVLFNPWTPPKQTSI